MGVGFDIRPLAPFLSVLLIFVGIRYRFHPYSRASGRLVTENLHFFYVFCNITGIRSIEDIRNIIDIRNIVLSLQSPLAIFSYGDKEKSQNVIIELKHKSKYFLVGMFITYYKEIDVISIRGLFPKDTAEWLNWIIQGKSLYLNKQKIQALIDQQRINLADVAYLDLNLVESLLETFVNPLQR